MPARFRLTLFAAVVVSLAACAFARADGITVSAAVSLNEALTEVRDVFEKQGGERVGLNFGASGVLLTQIRNGAPVDVFIAAADKQMDDAQTLDLIEASTRTVIAGNSLVLI